jgi:hypothetical protein
MYIQLFIQEIALILKRVRRGKAEDSPEFGRSGRFVHYPRFVWFNTYLTLEQSVAG